MGQLLVAHAVASKRPPARRALQLREGQCACPLATRGALSEAGAILWVVRHSRGEEHHATIDRRPSPPAVRAAREDLRAVRAAVHLAEEVGAGLGDREVLQRALPPLWRLKAAGKSL
jgi:hypothetical protein